MLNIDYYNKNADDYNTKTLFANGVKPIREKFIERIVEHGNVLDAGCGSGRDSIEFIKRGFYVDAFDGSKEMSRIASQNTGIDVRHDTFENLILDKEYDGIWAFASLLHVSPDNLPRCINYLLKHLACDGTLFMSFKYGNGIRVDGDRIYTDVNEGFMGNIIEDKNEYHIEYETETNVDTSSGQTQWIYITVKKN